MFSPLFSFLFLDGLGFVLSIFQKKKKKKMIFFCGVFWGKNFGIFKIFIIYLNKIVNMVIKKVRDLYQSSGNFITLFGKNRCFFYTFPKFFKIPRKNGHFSG